MNQNQLKQAVAVAAVEYIKPKLHANAVVGVVQVLPLTCLLMNLLKLSIYLLLLLLALRQALSVCKNTELS